jgi:hypothetical protein
MSTLSELAAAIRRVMPFAPFPFQKPDGGGHYVVTEQEVKWINTVRDKLPLLLDKLSAPQKKFLLRRLLNEVLAVRDQADQDKKWSEASAKVFKTHWEEIVPLLIALNIEFDWKDPDASHEEDVRSYAGAVEKLRESLT